MKNRSLAVLAIALTLAPAVAQATCIGDPTKLVTACAVGEVFDPETQSCTALTG